MEKTKSSKMLIIVSAIIMSSIIIALIVLIVLKINKKPLEISISNAVSYPEFNKDTTNYIIYTQENSISFSCEGAKEIEGCNSSVNLKTDETTHTIVIGNKTYTYEIKRIPKNSSTISITEIRGIPTSWTKSANLSVIVDNTTNIGYLEYTFDGGKNWQTTNSAKITQNGIYKIQVKDYFGFLSNIETVKITQIDSDSPTVEISRENTGASEAILSAVAADSVSGIKSYSWNTGAMTPSITVRKSGTYTVTVSDNAGNQTKKSVTVNFSTSTSPSDNTSNTKPSGSSSSSTPIPIPNPKPNPTPTPQPPNITPEPVIPTKSFSALFIGNGSTIEAPSRTCETNGDSCVVSAPQITRAGYEIMGWSTNQNSTSAEIAPGQQISLSGNMTYYAITKRSVKIEFAIQDSKATKDKNIEKSCTIYNQQSYCLVPSPNLKMEKDYTLVGWNQDKKAETSTLNPDSIYELSDNITFYSITKYNIPLSAEFIIENEQSATAEGGVKECYLFNGSDSCVLTAPELVAKDGYTAYGWHDPEDVNLVTLESGETFIKTETSASVFYAVVKNNSINTLTFVIQDTDAVTVDGELTQTCTPDKDGKCKITNIPEVSNKEGYEFIGWSEKSDSEEIIEDIEEGIEIGGDKTVYSVTKNTTPLKAEFVVVDTKAGTIPEDKKNAECYLYNGNNSCEVEMPTFEEKSGYEFIGWTEIEGGTSGSSKEKTSISEDTVFYSITREKTALSATFNILDSTVSSMSGGETICYRYNGEDACEITSPTINTVSGYVALGWDKNSESTTAEYKSGSKIRISGGERFYSIVQHGVQLTLHVGDSSEIITCVATSTVNCRYELPDPSSIAPGKYIGWSTKKDSATVEYEIGDTITFATNTELYAISVTAVTIVFQVQDQNATTTETTSVSCYLYNNEPSCEIEVPYLVGKDGYVILGWNKTPEATTASVSSGARINVSGSDTYYSITRKSTPISVSFNISENGPLVDEGEVIATTSDDSVSCYLFNGAEKCTMTAPTLTALKGYTAVGWSKEKHGTKADLLSGESFMAGAEEIYYSVVEKASTMSFNKNTSFINGGSLTDWVNNNIMADSLSFASASCISYNAKYCHLTEAPRIYSAGNRVIGFSTEPGGNPFLAFLSGFSKNGTLYARVWNFVENDSNFTLGTINKVVVDTPTKNDYYPIEYQSTISSSVQSAYTNYIVRLFTNVPALAQTYGKIRFSNMETYDSYGTDYQGSAGLTYVALGSYAFVDIMSPYDNVAYSDVKHVVTHELGHSIDAFYYDRTGKYLHDYPAFMEEYNNLKAIRESQPSTTPASERPLSAYAFQSEYEFLSEAFVAYYRDNYNGYARDNLGYTTPSLNNAFNRYLCYAENSFNMESSNCE